jgi:ADP-ribose pyrophosphatase YjhB (NUDIX family)
MDNVWQPAVTVAAIIERDGRFLLIEEDAEGERVFNQPAGHWEPGETLEAACAREALEESACRFMPRALVGIYHWQAGANGVTYLRFAFCGDIAGFDEGRPLDRGIVRAVWLDAEEIRRSTARHRSPLVRQCVEDYLAGRRFPLELVRHVP